MWTFYDYVDETGTNLIFEWLSGLSVKARAKVQTRIRNLERLPREQWGDWTGSLVGSGWEGILEMRFFVDRVRLRPLFCYGPGQRSATILMGAVEVGGEIEPRSASATCRARASEVRRGNHAVRHPFD